MFIKATKTHTDKHGRARKTHRLVRSFRVEGRVRQETLLNLGTGWDAPKELWPRISQRVEEILLGHQGLFTEEMEVESHAEALARQLQAKGFRVPGQAGPTLARVDLDSMEKQHSVSVGAERICLKALQDLEFERILLACGLTPRDARIALAVVAARMIHPGSERETRRWLRAASALPELLGLDGKPGALKRKTLYRICGLLWTHRIALQRGLRRREGALFGIPPAIVLYDLTNIHTCGTAKGSLRRRGRSKQRRHDCPLVTTALMLDGAGFPRACEILPGNISESGTLADAMDRLRAACDPEHPAPTVVMDAGIATEANLAWLREQGYDWVCVNRGKIPPRPDGEPDLEFVTAARHELQVWSVEGDDEAGERREQRLYVHSNAKQAKGDAILSARRERFEAELRKLHEGLTKPHCTKKYERVLERVGRLRERYATVSGQYDIDVEPEAGDGKRSGVNAVAVRVSCRPAHDEAAAGVGAYLLRTSRTDWGLREVVDQYLQLTEIEAVFRALKGELGLRPVWHRLDKQVRAQLFLSVLAYHAVHLIRTRLKRDRNNLCWASIRNRLQTWVRVTTTLQEVDGPVLAIRQDVRPPAEAAGIARLVGVKPGPHRIRSRR